MSAVHIDAKLVADGLGADRTDARLVEMSNGRISAPFARVC
jgi:hypothetical protein